MSAVEVRLYPTGSNAPVLLGDLTDPQTHGIEGIAGDESRELQVERLPRAATVTVFARQNRAESLTITVARLHGDLADAFLYWFRHPGDVPLKADVQFTQDGAQAWLNGCGIQAVRRRERPGGGLTTFFEYQLVGGAWSNTRAT